MKVKLTNIHVINRFISYIPKERGDQEEKMIQENWKMQGLAGLYLLVWPNIANIFINPT